MVPPASHRIPRVLWYSGTGQLIQPFGYGPLTLFGSPFQNSSPRFPHAFCRPTTPSNRSRMVWAPSLSLAATDEIDLSFFSSGYLDVSVPRVPFHALWIGAWMTEVSSAGFPHSEISGSMDICSSPKLFAAYHVFLRPLVPRHPPCALSA